MAGTNGGGQQQLAPLRDVTRWAASFMARLFTSAAPEQLLAEDKVLSGGGCYKSQYQSVSTEEEDVDHDGDARRGPVFGADADESEEQLLADGDGDGDDHPGARDVRSDHCLGYGVRVTSAAHDHLRRRPAGAADAAMEESEPLVLRRRAAKRANDVETLDHPFGCDRRGTEASTLLLLSS